MKTIDILIKAINMVEDKQLRKLILDAFKQYNDELLAMNYKIRKILNK